MEAVIFPRDHETVAPEALGTATATRAVIKSTGPSKLHGVCQVVVHHGRSRTIAPPDHVFTVIHQLCFVTRPMHENGSPQLL